MLSYKFRSNIFQIVSFGVIWGCAGLVYSILEKGILGDQTYYPATGNPYRFEDTVFTTFLLTTVLGLVVGTLEAMYLRGLFSRMSLAQKIIFKTLLYLVILVVMLMIITTIYSAVVLKTHLFDSEALHDVRLFITSGAFWRVEVYMAAVIVVSLFYSEVSQNLGPAVLLNFLTGRYHTPREEERIFMFLDMKSSTTIAEKIGHLKYFNMLKAYFADLSDPILRHEGEIYQYVGDEIVISWRLQKGLKDAHCVQCFYDMQRALEHRKAYYLEKFGVAPAFKAGLHYGKVTTGEIGVIKKDIIFTGDVLNATARIQSLCNSHQVDILISGVLLQRLDLSDRCSVLSLGESELRGRGEKLALYTLQPQ
ncbi:adenylate/guanylate cyclase domain-containing protein [Dawidia soli]|uniref:Adenylate/guanylate cyclase domain-containing protein n=1 Tax=Dawidia soli TaxID=2782352 RepID=A0AAP2GIQ6_9BACT|nr:adenylate/guanylate cyclase domain-containing protein [Dawidia soli]MBT1687188.1 adenylate/guanylate cyclase domain-containing protein [Dawidia soli]